MCRGALSVRGWEQQGRGLCGTKCVVGRLIIAMTRAHVLCEVVSLCQPVCAAAYVC